MAELAAILLLGFVLGMRHATDADHVVAVTTIVTRRLRLLEALQVGALWGVGHTLTIFTVGAAIIVFNVVIPTRVGLAMELAVGVMLVLLGFANLSGFTQWLTDTLTPFGALSPRPPLHEGAEHRHAEESAIHSHVHSHGDFVHTHSHGHSSLTHGHEDTAVAPAVLDRRYGGLGLYQTLRPLIVGLVHGLAGSAAVALLVLATIHDPRWSLAYLLLFGFGTIAGMMLITLALATPLALGARRFERFTSWMVTSSGLLSLAFGLFVIWHIGFVDGLFLATAHWTPQ